MALYKLGVYDYDHDLRESEADAGDLSIDVRESDIADGSPLASDG